MALADPARRRVLAALLGAPLALAWRPAAAAEFSFRTGEVRIQLLAEPGLPAAGVDGLRRWVARAVASLAGYAGQFPVREAYVAIRMRPGAIGGRTFATDPPVVNITMDPATDRSRLDADWVLVHEFVHLAVPSLPREQRWFEEGLAVYVEAMARTRSGMKRPEDLWTELYTGLPNGEPYPGEGGLDGTGRWGRIYWAGAAFWLRVDVEARAEAGAGLPQILAAWRARGWDIRAPVSLPELVAAADAALGVPVVSSLYERFGPSARDLDLRRLWQDLGVAVAGGNVRLDDRAPLARIRQALLAAH